MHRPAAALLLTATTLALLAPPAPYARQPEPQPFAAQGIPAVPLPDAPVTYAPRRENASGSRW